MHLSSVTFKELLSKTLDKLNNIEIRSTNNNYDYFAIFWFIIFFQVNLLKTLLVEKKRNSFGPSCPVLQKMFSSVEAFAHYLTSEI